MIDRTKEYDEGFIDGIKYCMQILEDLFIQIEVEMENKKNV